MTQGHFLIKFESLRVGSILSHRPASVPWLKSCISYYLHIPDRGEEIDSFLSQNTNSIVHHIKPGRWGNFFFNILAYLNNAVVWMISTRALISKSLNPCTCPLKTVPRAPLTISVNVTFIFHSFFNSLARWKYSSFFSLALNFSQWPAGTAKSTIQQVLFFVDFYKVMSSDQD